MDATQNLSATNDDKLHELPRDGVASSAQAPGEPDNSVDTGTVSDIIVTAQRRGERLQDVPISVSAIGEDRLASQGVDGPSGLTISVPGLVFNRIANDANIYIRGIGTNLYGPNAEQTVAVYVDGIYHASPEAANFSFNNIERVEVLKGPQGTLFGRNTTGGVVQIITKDPSNQPSLDLAVGYGKYDTLNASLYAATGITDNLAVDVAATYANQGDGYGRNLVTGEETGLQARHDYAVRSNALWRPTESTKIVLQGDISRNTNTDSHQIVQGVTGVDGVTTFPGRYNSTTLVTDYIRSKSGGASGTITQQIGGIDLVSISAYRRSKSNYLIDQDSTPLVASDDFVASLTRTFSQEVQLQSRSSGPLTWQVGGFYYFSHAGFEPITVDTPLGRVLIDAFQRTRSFAAFGQASYEILPDTNITSGMRYTSEKQTLVVQDFNVFGASIPLPEQLQRFKNVTFRLSVDHKFSGDVMGYISFNRGFKSGGFNLADPAGPGYKPETLDAYEAGLKTELFDHRLRLNGAAFYYNYRDIQAAIPRAGGTVVTNGPKARVLGAEFDFEAHITPEFIVSGGATILNTKYLNYPNAPFISATGILTSGDAKGNKLLGASPFTGSVTAEYHIETGFGKIVPAIAVSYNDGYYFYSDNRLKQPSYILLNPSITWSSADDRYSLKLYARNLLNETYYLNRSEQAGLTDVQRAAQPRTYGATISARF